MGGGGGSRPTRGDSTTSGTSWVVGTDKTRGGPSESHPAGWRPRSWETWMVNTKVQTRARLESLTENRLLPGTQGLGIEIKRGGPKSSTANLWCREKVECGGGDLKIPSKNSTFTETLGWGQKWRIVVSKTPSHQHKKRSIKGEPFPPRRKASLGPENWGGNGKQKEGGVMAGETESSERSTKGG